MIQDNNALNQNFIENKKISHRGRKKTLEGIVVSNKMNKTINVLVERRFIDPLYKKVVKKYKKFMAHDEKNEANIGDFVRIIETRPLSKNKNFKLDKILKREITK